MASARITGGGGNGRDFPPLECHIPHTDFHFSIAGGYSPHCLEKFCTGDDLFKKWSCNSSPRLIKNSVQKFLPPIVNFFLNLGIPHWFLLIRALEMAGVAVLTLSLKILLIFYLEKQQQKVTFVQFGSHAK